MASPFAVFRRNQKVMTVILTCLAMFAFIILDSVSKMDSSAIIPIMFGLAGAALAWLWGSQNERGISYSTIGFGAVAGAVAGAIFVSQASNQGGISTSLGRLSNQDLFEMKQKRDMANQFVAGAFRERKENVYAFMMERYMFGGTTTREVVVKMLLDHEADELGIAISDDYITNYIKEVSENSITRKKLTELRGQIGMGESELYDLLRSELRAQVAYRVLNPEIVHMPDQYWADFEKLNVRHSIDAVAIPVEPFAERMERPSDSELNELFEAFKGVYPMGENPGFMQPDRLSLAWFESDYESAEKLVGEIPEDELKARYEERKEIDYKIETLPDMDSGFDGGLKFGEPPAPVKTSPPSGDDKPTDDKPKAETPKAETPKAETPNKDAKVDPAAKPDGDAPAAPVNKDDAAKKPAAPKKEAPPKDDLPAPADAKETEPESPESEECGDGEDQQPTDAADDKKADATAKPAESESESAAKPKEEPKPAETSPAEKAASGNEAAKPVDTTGEDSKSPTDAPASEIKYRPLEEVRDEIRDLMLREKTEELMASQITEAMTAVKDWRFELREATPDISDEDLAEAISEKAKAYAGKHGLKFVATDELLSQQELIDHEDYRIATAREPFDPANFATQTQPQTVATRLYTGATSLFIPEEAQSQFDDTRYAFWATGENPQHVPTLDEPGVREQVEKAARLKNARPKAEARANELAKLVQGKFDESSIVTMSEGVAGQSVLGEVKTDKPGSATDKSAVKADEAKSDDGTEAESESDGSCGDEEAEPKEAEASAPKLIVDEPEPAKETVDEALSVISSPPFTWLRQSSQGMQMNPFSQPTVEFGIIPGIDGVDDNFMQTVADTAVGDVVVIPNFTKDVYYVVHVKARNPSGVNDPSLAPVRQQFITENAPMSPIYGRLANSQASEIHQRWMAEFLTKHNIDIAELDAI